jgi:hypothetical protein
MHITTCGSEPPPKRMTYVHMQDEDKFPWYLHQVDCVRAHPVADVHFFLSISVSLIFFPFFPSLTQSRPLLFVFLLYCNYYCTRVTLQHLYTYSFQTSSQIKFQDLTLVAVVFLLPQKFVRPPCWCCSYQVS